MDRQASESYCSLAVVTQEWEGGRGRLRGWADKTSDNIITHTIDTLIFAGSRFEFKTKLQVPLKVPVSFGVAAWQKILHHILKCRHQ